MASRADKEHTPLVVSALRVLPDAPDLPDNEEAVMRCWRREDTFKRSLKLREKGPTYTFYDGPPFATGLPHYGHLLAGTLKDIVPRYWAMMGCNVQRRFGWDCHGLPVEYEIDKQLGIKGPDDVAAMGIDVYNDKCRQIVMRYSAEWRHQVERIGRWVDFDNDYKTMYPWFMESVWWVFKQLYEKGLIYRGYKVMPYSTACATPLSNFEAGQAYKDVQDPAVWVSLPLDQQPGVGLVVWTTTPWTLPSNMAACVHPDLDYVKVTELSTGHQYILMKDRVFCSDHDRLWKSPDTELEVLHTYKGRELAGLTYSPPFDYFIERKKSGAFRVVCDTYVTTDAGTGVVHQAPYFGEDDQRVCLREGIIAADSGIVCPIDATGRFTDEVTHFQGQYVKDADKSITAHLKSSGRLVKQSTMQHSYPHCWRSDTPLIYRAVPSWFVRVEQHRETLLRCNQAPAWVPSHVKDKRFHNWLDQARDWAISRNRYWGCPLPLWTDEQMEEIVCVGSIDELQRLTGVQNIDDLHRETVDKLTIPSARVPGRQLRRVTEVLDCWFESGSMPYAQSHYPFENKKHFEDNFPADFIAEGIDQTRGWFYTLLVLSALLFDKPPFKNLIVNGIVLAEDGQKMSKRLKNYPDPMEIVHKYGADALRLYLINSPAVRGDNLRFRESGVRDILKDVFLPWYNACRFLTQNLVLFMDNGGTADGGDGSFALDLHRSENLMDKWIVSYTTSLVAFVREEMAQYRLYTVVPRLVKFVDTMTNWFVRMNRRRLKGESGDREDTRAALGTLLWVNCTLVRLMAPFTPFIADYMWRHLRPVLDQGEPENQAVSVHLTSMPRPDDSLVDAVVEARVAAMQQVVELARLLRDRHTVPLKYPVCELVVIHRDAEFLAHVDAMLDYVCEECNVRRVTLSADKATWGVQLKPELDYRALGQRLRGDMKRVADHINKLPQSALEEYVQCGSMSVCGHTLSEPEVRMHYALAEGKDTAGGHQYKAHSDGQLTVLLDVTPDDSLQQEGLAREVVNRIQKLRKKAKLQPSDAVAAYCRVEPEHCPLAAAFATHCDMIATATKQPVYVDKKPPAKCKVVESEAFPVKDSTLFIVLAHERPESAAVLSVCNGVGEGSGNELFVQYGSGVRSVSVLAADGTGMNIERLLREARASHGVETLANVRLCSDSAGLQPVNVEPAQLLGRTLFLCPVRPRA